MNKFTEAPLEAGLYTKVANLIEQSKEQVVIQANSTLTLLYWQIGTQINEFVLGDKRAAYGKQIVVSLFMQLVAKYGKSIEQRNLRRMLQFAEQFTDNAIVSTLSTQLSWSHFVTLLGIKTQESRLFYAYKIANETWSVRTLRKQIETKTYERTLFGNTQLPVEISETQNIFKDPYLLDF